jgi:hypothetical protein
VKRKLSGRLPFTQYIRPKQSSRDRLSRPLSATERALLNACCSLVETITLLSVPTDLVQDPIDELKTWLKGDDLAAKPRKRKRK